MSKVDELRATFLSKWALGVNGTPLSMVQKQIDRLIEAARQEGREAPPPNEPDNTKPVFAVGRVYLNPDEATKLYDEAPKVYSNVCTCHESWHNHVLHCSCNCHQPTASEAPLLTAAKALVDWVKTAEAPGDAANRVPQLQALIDVVDAAHAPDPED